VGVNQYVNSKETPLPVPTNEPTTFHKRRAQQIASHRTSLEDADNEVVLKKLGGIVNVRGDRLFSECVEAAVAGATLGEIVRAIRINDRPCAPVTPVTLTRAAAALEGK
jgi:methylmalonyl-CoA mutase N-terminal domain/subunit